jgi:hypothetical protein
MNLQDAFTVATRGYFDPSIVKKCRDRLVRTARGTFYLIEEATEPGGREVYRSLSLADVFDWYRLEPWQIERTVVAGSE